MCACLYMYIYSLQFYLLSIVKKCITLLGRWQLAALSAVPSFYGATSLTTDQTTTAVGEIGVYRHQGSPIEGSPEVFRTSQDYGIEGF